MLFVGRGNLVRLNVGLVVDLFREPAALDVWRVQPAYMNLSNTFGSCALLRRRGRYTPVARESKFFTGRARARSLCGFVGVDLSCNAHRVERTQRDTRLDGVDHYFALFQVAGASTIVQNDRAMQLIVGDVAFVDSAQPGTYISESGHGQWFSLQLPRRSLVSYLGFNPQGGVLGRSGTVVGRALFDLVRNADTAYASAFSEPYMQLVVYDLIGALFVPSNPGRSPFMRTSCSSASATS
jgi:AraC family transcriptional activator of tynA and feaB